MEQKLEFKGDKLYRYTPIPGTEYHPTWEIMKEELVMTKDIFIACYNKWIKEEEN